MVGQVIAVIALVWSVSACCPRTYSCQDPLPSSVGKWSFLRFADSLWKDVYWHTGYDPSGVIISSNGALTFINERRDAGVGVAFHIVGLD